MHSKKQEHWQHDHTFDQDLKKPGESRTLIVIVMTATMMVIELIAGVVYGSMALLADGLHMASHTVALSISAFAYIYARKHARNRQFSFGTGKVNALGGYTGAVLLALFAIYMAFESVLRLLKPVDIEFNQAIFVATLGLLVNGLSVLVLGVHDHDDHHHDHHHDHNLKSAYLHVLADALTSILAIVALLAGKFAGFNWLDPIMGIVGALLVARWSLGLLKTTSTTLLDRQAPENLRNTIRSSIEDNKDTTITDLHVWEIGPDIYSAAISLVADTPLSPNHYKSLIPGNIGVVHVTLEIHQYGTSD